MKALLLSTTFVTMLLGSLLLNHKKVNLEITALQTINIKALHTYFTLALKALLEI